MNTFEKIITVNGRTFTLTSGSAPEKIDITPISEANGIYEYKLSVAGATAPMVIKWSIHMQGILSYWCPTARRDRRIYQWYSADRNASVSNLYSGAPVLAVIEQGELNRQTVALSDAVSTAKMSFSVNDFEEKENLDTLVYLFEDGIPESEYSVIIRIDDRKIPYYDAIGEVSKWWRQFYPCERTRTETGEYPLYSTWYNYHQHPNSESLLRELELAAKCGFKSLIIDDGWSYDGNGSGTYCDCGNWQFSKSKFPDFADFVRKCHNIGVKVALWFPVPLVGYNTEDFKKYRNKMLYLSDGFEAGIIDPRYPEMRDYITDTYVNITRDYDLDGLKLDFIDSFKKRPDFTEVTDQPDDKDCETVEEGVMRLLDDIRTRLTSQKPDFMIEFRQNYVGPIMANACNMLRVGDCPFEALNNRIGIGDLRLQNYDLAVHADMLVWSKDETLVDSAKMLLNVMFGTPQISVLLQESTAEQLQLIKNHVDYWYKNRAVIMRGHFKATDPDCLYSTMSSESDEKRIAVSYTRNSYLYDGKQTDLFNATASDVFYIDNDTVTGAKVTIRDCLGTVITEATLHAGVSKLTIPQGGMAEIGN